MNLTDGGSNVLKTQAIRKVLDHSGNVHLTRLYSPEMEVQVNVAQDDGKKVFFTYAGKKRSAWQNDKGEQWKSFRIPFMADSNPQYEDREITFDLATHVESIGMTGWNWQKRQSIWVGFDFDSIVNHKMGIDQEELDKIKTICSELDYVTIVKSTSGKGLHLYIFIEDGFITVNHKEHASLAKAILSVLSIDAGYNLQSSIDVCGGILWCHHRKQIGTDGLSLIKMGGKLPISRIPQNWKEYSSIGASGSTIFKTKEFKTLFSSIRSQDLDSRHKQLMQWFTKNSTRDFWWDADHNMFVCHTLDLLAAHKELSLRGIFYTNSSGSTNQNCFAFPEENGSWEVRRHGGQVNEHPYWIKDSTGWTKCKYNATAELLPASRTNGGILNSKKEIVFKDHKLGLKTLSDIGIIISIDEYIKIDPNPRILIIKEKESTLTIFLAIREGEKIPESFIESKKGFIETTVEYFGNQKTTMVSDALIRYCLANDSEAGWFINIKEKWIPQNKGNVLTVLMGELNKTRQEVETIIGRSILVPWYLVNKPFKEEYIGKRQWNRDAASFHCIPNEGDFPTWLELFNHCGENLTDSVLDNQWCERNEILTGSDYLFCWFANLIQRPEISLPYLFFIGEQNTGKSTLHEAFGQFIIKSGYIRADNALTSQGGFNNELSNAVLCVVEETDLRKNKEAGNRIKDWVTGKTISIRALYKNSYDIENMTHWIQCANDINYCVISSGDTRVVIVRVGQLKQEVPKHILFNKLKAEAPAFLHYLLSIDLPDPHGRLAVDCLSTIDKTEIELSNMSEVEQFINEKCLFCDGKTIDFDSLYNTFMDWLPSDRRPLWSKNKLSREIPKRKRICKGKLGNENITVVGNITFDLTATPENFYYRTNSSTGRLIKSEETANDSSN